ncbi:MAG TPA: oligosaccharide flippase family protein [Casimicrobiaceae bacterium]|nr:oligosaccharide flippase family protein [Casimicrobiaceae bacterium]
MKLFRVYAVLSAGQIASRLLGLLAFGWLARALEPDGYGAAEYVIGIALVVSILIDGGSGVVGVRRAVHDPAGLPGVAFQILLARLAFTAIGVPVSGLVALSTATSAVPLGLAVLFGASLLAAPWRQEWVFQATGRMRNVAWGQVIRAAVFAALAWSLVRAPGDLVAVGWAESGAVAAFTGYCLYLQHTRVTPIRVRGSLRGFAALVRESAVAGAANGIWHLAQYAPLLMIGALAGGARTAWFAAAARIVGALMVVTYIYHYGLYPAVSRAVHADGELGPLLARSCRVAAWGGLFLALALTLLAEPLVVLAMGDKLASAAPMLRVMAWALPVSLCSGHALGALAAVGAQTRLLWTQLAGLGAVVGVGLVFGQKGDGLGFAFASLSTAVALWLVAHIFAARRRLAPPPFRLALAPAILAATILIGASLTDSGPWLSIAWLAAYAAAAPLIDRRLLSDFSALGRSSLSLEAMRGP